MVPTFKRAMTFVRYVLGFKSQNIWKNFTDSDLKLNHRCFKRWGVHERNIFAQCPKYLQLQDTAPRAVSLVSRKRKLVESATSASDSPLKRVYEIASDSTDEDE